MRLNYPKRQGRGHRSKGGGGLGLNSYIIVDAREQARTCECKSGTIQPPKPHSAYALQLVQKHLAELASL